MECKGAPTHVAGEYTLDGVRNELASAEVLVFLYSVVDMLFSEVAGGGASFDRLGLTNETVRNVPMRGGVDDVQSHGCLGMDASLEFGC